VARPARQGRAPPEGRHARDLRPPRHARAARRAALRAGGALDARGRGRRAAAAAARGLLAAARALRPPRDGPRARQRAERALPGGLRLLLAVAPLGDAADVPFALIYILLERTNFHGLRI